MAKLNPTACRSLGAGLPAVGASSGSPTRAGLRAAQLALSALLLVGLPVDAQVQPAAAQPSTAGFGKRDYDFGGNAPDAGRSTSADDGARNGSGTPASLHTQGVAVPRVAGRLTSKDIGLVINIADPYSVQVGEFYVKARRLAPAQVLRVALPVRPHLTPAEFQTLAAAINARFAPTVQAVALAWTTPYAVNCNSITGAIALGYDASLCDHGCAASRPSRYFNSATVRPYVDLKVRLSMLLAASDVATAKAMITRGVESDATLPARNAPPVNAYFVRTNDTTRSVRSAQFPAPGRLPALGVDIHVDATQAIEHKQRILLYLTGLPRVDKLDTLKWVPGALADHLTSFGGQLEGGHEQMSALEWIGSGATASYGTVSEPCAHPQKFPHPQVLLLNYLQGTTAIEAYWKSVAWPQQGVFIGEPLAAPFARR